MRKEGSGFGQTGRAFQHIQEETAPEGKHRGQPRPSQRHVHRQEPKDKRRGAVRVIIDILGWLRYKNGNACAGVWDVHLFLQLNYHIIDYCMSKYLKVPARQTVIAVTELNEEILTPEDARGTVRECSYQVVSGSLETYSHFQTSEILLALLPLSVYLSKLLSNRLIDICLPFAPNGIPVLARYILFDNKLRGIRVCSGGGSSEWPMHRVEHLPPPIELQRYYR